MASNLETLKSAGVIPEEAALSAAELAVIDGMSDTEVQTLVDIRKRLNDEIAKQGTTAIASGDVTPSANFIV